MNKSAAAAYFNVFTVREGPGFNLELSALPLDGRLVALAPTGDEEAQGE